MKRDTGGTELTPLLRALAESAATGLPLVTRPYAHLAARLGVDEKTVLDGLRTLLDDGVVKRLGVIVRHRRLGYTANAMVVWDLPDERVAETGRRLGGDPLVKLCYRRPRRLPDWPYNLFTMIHGRDRDSVTRDVNLLAERHGLDDTPRALLFSHRAYKQRGARYGTATDTRRHGPTTAAGDA